MKKYIKKNIEYILTLLGIWLFAWNSFFLFPFAKSGAYYYDSGYSGYDYRDQMKFLAVILITLGIAIGVKKYLKK